MSLDEEWDQSGSVAEGTTLRAVMAGKRLEQRRALLIIRQVLEALAAAHTAGAIRGDIKPETIIILPGLGDVRVKLADVAAAPVTARDPVYTAPESVLGPIDARADLYSVGAVLFELLTGHPPFFADDAGALRRLHTYAPIQSLKQRAPDVAFADGLEALVATALAKKRDARFQSASEMIAALDPALQAIEATPPPASEDRPAPNDSLLLLAKDLMPQPRAAGLAANEPLVPLNVGRKVPELGWSTRAHLMARRALARAREHTLGLRERLAKLDRSQRRILGGVVAALLLGLVIAIATCATAGTTAYPDKARELVTLGDTELARGHDALALNAYENAVRLAPAIATEATVIESLGRIARSKDAATAFGALELIALRSGPRGRPVLVTHASTNPQADVRQGAVLLAERAGVADQIDRVQSWSLDLGQAASCDDRRAAIEKLAATKDSRALPALRKAKSHKCVESDANSAIERISAAAKHP